MQANSDAARRVPARTGAASAATAPSPRLWCLRGEGWVERLSAMSLPDLVLAPTKSTPEKPAPKIAIAGLTKTFTTRTGPFTALAARLGRSALLPGAVAHRREFREDGE